MYTVLADWPLGRVIMKIKFRKSKTWDGVGMPPIGEVVQTHGFFPCRHGEAACFNDDMDEYDDLVVIGYAMMSDGMAAILRYYKAEGLYSKEWIDYAYPHMMRLPRIY